MLPSGQRIPRYLPRQDRTFGRLLDAKGIIFSGVADFSETQSLCIIAPVLDPEPLIHKVLIFFNLLDSPGLGKNGVQEPQLVFHPELPGVVDRVVLVFAILPVYPGTMFRMILDIPPVFLLLSPVDQFHL